MKRYLITGGAGSIGSEIARQLITRGDQVVVIDNLSGGSLENIEDLPEAEVHIADVREPILLTNIMHDVDAVFHHAASLGVKNILEHPLQCARNNIEGTHVVLDITARFGKPTLIASTSEVYGLSDRLPFSEDDPTVLGASNKVRWSYACSKLMDEHIALASMQETGVPVIVTRYFNCTGRQQSSRYGMVVPTFIRQALEGEPITVHGDGTQSRCFADVRDTAYATIKLMDVKAFGHVVNIGSQNEITIGELARLVKERTSSSSKIHFIPYEQAYANGYEDMPRRVPNLKKLETLTGFKPSTSLVETIDRTVAFLREREAAEVF